MNLVDSSGWLEYFADAKNAKYFAPIIEDTNKLIVSTINLYEVYKKIALNKDEQSAITAIGLMQQAKIIDVNASISIQAAKISIELNIPMADSLIIATGKYTNSIIWTQDSDFRGIENVKYISKN